MKTLLFIGIGSFMGGIARYCRPRSPIFVRAGVRGLTRFVTAGCGSELPWGTFAVNILGCFLLGVLYQLFSGAVNLPPALRLLLTVGFCGGFTTFSTFVAEDFAMLSAARYFAAASYTALSVLAGLGAMWVGSRLALLFQG